MRRLTIFTRMALERVGHWEWKGHRNPYRNDCRKKFISDKCREGQIENKDTYDKKADFLKVK